LINHLALGSSGVPRDHSLLALVEESELCAAVQLQLVHERLSDLLQRETWFAAHLNYWHVSRLPLAGLVLLMGLVQDHVPLKFLGETFDDGKLDGEERVECGRDVFANVALYSRLELPVHKIDNNRLVAGRKGVPVLLCNHVVRAV